MKSIDNRLVYARQYVGLRYNFHYMIISILIIKTL